MLNAMSFGPPENRYDKSYANILAIVAYLQKF